MAIPIDRLAGALRAAGAAKKDSDVPVRVAVFVDVSASAFLVGAVRRALVPQTTSALVRVERLEPGRPSVVKPDTDISLVLTCGGEHLQEAVQQVVIGGAPTAVLAESAVEAPFIQADTPMLGLICATDETYLLETLARWILDRTDKDTAFAANFPFMRVAAANRVIANAALANMATGALFFIPGADFPVMTLAQLGMMGRLALVYGKPIRPERGYEAVGVVAAGLLLRAGARRAAPAAGHAAFAVKALVGGAGTYAVGRGLSALYERDVDYARANEALARLAARGRELVALVRGCAAAPAGGSDGRAA